MKRINPKFATKSFRLCLSLFSVCASTFDPSNPAVCTASLRPVLISGVSGVGKTIGRVLAEDQLKPVYFKIKIDELC